MAKLQLVEDDRRIRIEVMAALAAEGLEVAVAVDLAGAEAALDSDIDLVVIDRGLPDGDGIGLCAETRSRARTHRSACCRWNAATVADARRVAAASQPVTTGRITRPCTSVSR